MNRSKMEDLVDDKNKSRKYRYEADTGACWVQGGEDSQAPLRLPRPDISGCAVFILFTLQAAARHRHLPF